MSQIKLLLAGATLLPYALSAQQQAFTFSANAPLYGIYASDALSGHTLQAGITAGVTRAHYRMASADLLPTTFTAPLLGVAALQVSTCELGASALAAELSARGLACGQLTMKFGTLTLGDDVEGEDYFYAGQSETRYYRGAQYTFYLDGEPFVGGVMPALEFVTDFNDPLDDVVSVRTDFTAVEDRSSPLNAAVHACAAAFLQDLDGRTIRFRYDNLLKTPVGTTGLLFASSLGYVDIGPKADPQLATAAIAPGTANSCTPIGSVMSNGDGTWKHLVVGGNRVASFLDSEAMGLMTAGLYVNTGAIRKHGDDIEVLDRNIIITPQTQPSDSVYVRLYFTAQEWADLVTANDNDNNDLSGTHDLRIRKYPSDVCEGTFPSMSSTVLTPRHYGLVGDDHYVDVKVNSFSNFFAEGEEAAPVPLDLLAFDAEASAAAVRLTWTTSNEVSTADFVVERSDDTHDWQSVATVPARGSGAHRYATIDASSGGSDGPVYYRLLMRDLDGSRAYSSTVAVTPGQIAGTMARVFPNPVVRGAQVSTDFAAGLPVEAYDLQGRLLATVRPGEGGALATAGLPEGQIVLRQAGRVVRLVVR